MKRGGLDLGVLNKRSPASCISIDCELTGFLHSHASDYTSAKNSVQPVSTTKRDLHFPRLWLSMKPSSQKFEMTALGSASSVQGSFSAMRLGNLNVP